MGGKWNYDRLGYSTIGEVHGLEITLVGMIRIICRILALGITTSLLFGREGGDDFLRWMNIGKAKLENRNSEQAMEAFANAMEVRPDSLEAIRNLARARMLANDLPAAVSLLREAADVGEGVSPATAYLMGLALARMSNFEGAVPFFEKAVELDPYTAALRYQLANAYQMVGEQKKAMEQLKETIRLDPLHASAHFRLAAFARQAGDMEGFRRHQGEFMRLRQLFGEESRRPEALEQCEYTKPEWISTRELPVGDASAVRFADQTSRVLSGVEISGVVACEVMEVGDGGVRWILVDSDGHGWLLGRKSGGRGADGRAVAVTGAKRFLAGRLGVGNFHDRVPDGAHYDPSVHALNDVLASDGRTVQLLQRVNSWEFEDRTREAGLAEIAGGAVEWIDYDHDGDLDIAVASEHGAALFQNRGDGTFAEATREAGIALPGRLNDVVAVDWDSNVAMDLVFSGKGEGTFILMNQRGGKFAKQTQPPGPLPAAQRVLCDDLNQDGNPDLVLLNSSKALIVYGRTSLRTTFPLELEALSDAVLIDYDNDGWLDLCLAGGDAAGKSHVLLFRNAGVGKWIERSAEAGLKQLELPPRVNLRGADFDGDHDTDLMVWGASGRLRFLRNDGGNRRQQLQLRLVGTKTNPMGIGTRVEVRAGPLWVTRCIRQLPIEIGIGQREAVDSIRTVWTNGVQDNQVDVSVGADPLTIKEKNVAAGSCPYLYAWDGKGYRFVTDLLGNSPVGLPVERGRFLPADPEEIVEVGDSMDFGPDQAGYYRLEVTEELREILYLDTVRLMVVDHPADTEVHSTDKLGHPASVPSEIRQMRPYAMVRKAIGEDGIDRTRAMRHLDGEFAPPGLRLPPPLRGLCREWKLTLDFGPVDPGRALILGLTGWLQYGDASVNIAVSQNNSVAMMPPRLEVETTSGWEPVNVEVGMPAGKTKTILCDLTGKLPADTRRFRLIGNVEIRWDRIALFERLRHPSRHVLSLKPSSARLYQRGYSEMRVRARGHPPTPDFAAVAAHPPWGTTPEGWYTRYGDVRPLLTEGDGKLVLVGGGDAVALTFEATGLPDIPEGWMRTLFFYSVGWDKDGDYNVAAGENVEPLPLRAPGAWELDYNTRWVPGRLSNH